jgi:hypothetical protein
MANPLAPGDAQLAGEPFHRAVVRQPHPIGVASDHLGDVGAAVSLAAQLDNEPPFFG